MNNQAELDLIYDLMHDAIVRIRNLRLNDSSSEAIEENVRLRDYLRGRIIKVSNAIKEEVLAKNYQEKVEYEAAAEEAEEGFLYMEEAAQKRYADNLEVVEDDRDFHEFLEMYGDHSLHNPEDNDDFLERGSYEEEEQDFHEFLAV